MTNIEQKALVQAVAAAGRRMQDYAIMAEENVLRQSIEAHARAIEQHEAFRQEVSEAVKNYYGDYPWDSMHPALSRFIITKPDPLQDAIAEVDCGPGWKDGQDYAKQVRAALAARGLEIVEKK